MRQFCMPITSTDIGSCIVGAASSSVKIPLLKLIFKQIFVKSGLHGLKAATPLDLNRGPLNTPVLL